MEATPRESPLRAGPIEIEPSRFEARVDGEHLRLTSRELRLLEALVRRPDRVVSREELSTVAWERPLRPEDRSVDVYVSRLRAKLEAAVPGWRFIHTHFGFGYRLSAVPLREPVGRLHSFAGTSGRS